LKKVYFPELECAAYYGIFSPDTPEESKISWDLIQVIRNKIAWSNRPEGGMTVDFGKPIQSSLSESLARVEVNIYDIE
jgi:hypothetical protein